jgi:hypothetical protein
MRTSQIPEEKKVGYDLLQRVQCLQTSASGGVAGTGVARTRGMDLPTRLAPFCLWIVYLKLSPDATPHKREIRVRGAGDKVCLASSPVLLKSTVKGELTFRVSVHYNVFQTLLHTPSRVQRLFKPFYSVLKR